MVVEMFRRLGLWPARTAPDESEFATPFEHPYYRYEKFVMEIGVYADRLLVLDTKGRNGRKLSVDEQMERKKLLAAIDARLRFIAQTVRKRGEDI